VKVVKNKLAPPFRVVEFDIMYGEGISKLGEIIDLGAQAGIIEKSGAWFSYDGQRIGQGRENTRAYLKEHPEVAAKIEQAIRHDAGLADAMMTRGAASEDSAEPDGETPAEAASE
jgi:recombination protein RecA